MAFDVLRSVAYSRESSRAVDDQTSRDVGGEVLGSLEWQAGALCAQVDPEAFFPEQGGSTREAKKVCLACEVRSECLDYALKHDERFGVWGGLSERERRKLKQRVI